MHSSVWLEKILNSMGVFTRSKVRNFIHYKIQCMTFLQVRTGSNYSRNSKQLIVYAYLICPVFLYGESMHCATSHSMIAVIKYTVFSYCEFVMLYIPITYVESYITTSVYASINPVLQLFTLIWGYVHRCV